MITPSQRVCLQTLIHCLLPALLLQGAMSPWAAAKPLDVSYQACLRRLNKPGAIPEMAALICGAVPYANQPSQSDREHRQFVEHAQISIEAQRELAYRLWLRAHPTGTHRQWLDELDAADRRLQLQAEQLHRLDTERQQAEAEAERLRQQLLSEAARSERELDRWCNSLLQNPPALNSNGKPKEHSERNRIAALHPACLYRGLRQLP